MAKKKIKKNGKKLKKTNGSVGGKADVHAHEEGKRNKSLLGHNAIYTWGYRRYPYQSSTWKI